LVKLGLRSLHRLRADLGECVIDFNVYKVPVSANNVNRVVMIATGVMQRTSRLKREMQLLSAEPPPGVSCWQVEERLDQLQARQSPFTSHYRPYLSKTSLLTASSFLSYSCVWYRDCWRRKHSLRRRAVHTGNQHTWEVSLYSTHPDGQQHWFFFFSDSIL